MIAPGTILMEGDALRPEFFDLADGPYPNAFMSLTHRLPPHDLEKELFRTGWSFLYMAGAIKTMAFGYDRAKMLNAALKRIIQQVREQRCNCFEVDRVETHSFLGLPYVNVSAHARRIQKRLVFPGQIDEQAADVLTA